MKKITFLIMLLCLAASAGAYSFQANGFFFNITSDVVPYTVSVTYKVSSNTPTTEYTGNMVIPQEVTSGGKTYSVTSIDAYAFYNCVNLTGISIPNTVFSVGTFAFYNCTTLTSVALPNNPNASYGNSAFRQCTGLTSITIPDLCTSISGSGTYIFYHCINLSNVILPNSLKTISVGAFGQCTSLKNINLPNALTTIGESSFAESGLTSIKIPNSVTSIEKFAFNGCFDLTSLNIPNLVTSLDIYTLNACTSLNKITIFNSTPPTISSSTTLIGVNTTTCILAVPKGAVGAYTANSYWGTFSNIKQYYNVTFNTLGGIGIFDNQYVVDGEKVIVPSSQPTKSNLTFSGWYTGTDYLTAWDFNNPVTNDLTLYAKWVATVSFDLQGGSGTIDNQSISEGGKAIAPVTNPTKPGLAFGGWYTSTNYQTAWNFNNTLSGNLTLYARWTTTVTSSAGDNGSISPLGVSEVTAGTVTTFTITPNTGYEINSLLYNGVDVTAQVINNSYNTPVINAAATIQVTFKKQLKSITLKSSDAGIIKTKYEYQSTPSFEIVASSGWKVHNVMYNGVDVTLSLVNGVFTIPPITTDGILSVSFETTTVTTSFSPELNHIKVYGSDNEIVVEGTLKGENITVYTLQGSELKRIKSESGKTFISVPKNSIYIVKTIAKTVKVVL